MLDSRLLAFANTRVPRRNIRFAMFNTRLEFVRQFKLILQEVLDPIPNLFNLQSRKRANGLLDLLNVAAQRQQLSQIVPTWPRYSLNRERLE